MTEPLFPRLPDEVLVPDKASAPKGIGRPKGSRNRSTIMVKEAIEAVYDDLQAGAGGDHAHFRAWADGNPTEFYRLFARLIPYQVNAAVNAGVIGTVVFELGND